MHNTYAIMQLRANCLEKQGDWPNARGNNCWK